MTSRDLVGVVVGATAGASGRWALGEIVGVRPGLLLANVVGCLVIGWAARRGTGPWLTAGWCGALTSFSALSVQLARDLDNGSIVRLTVWLAVTTAGCALAFGVGTRSAAIGRASP